MTSPAPSRAPIPTQLAVTRQAWRFARFAGDHDKAETARRRLDYLLEQLHATLPRQEQP